MTEPVISLADYWGYYSTIFWLSEGLFFLCLIDDKMNKSITY